MGCKRVKKSCNSCTSCTDDQGKGIGKVSEDQIPIIKDFDESFASELGVTASLSTPAAPVGGPPGRSASMTDLREDISKQLSQKAEKKLNKRVDHLQDMLGSVVSSVASVQIQMSELTEMTRACGETSTKKPTPKKGADAIKTAVHSWTLANPRETRKL